MIEINLVPDVKQELIRAQRMRATVISSAIITSIVAVGLVALLLIYVYAVQLGRGAYLDGQIKNKAAELAQVEDLSEMVTIQNQLGLISTLNNDKNITSRLFDMLSAVLPPAPNTVQVSQIDVNADDGTIRLEGQTRGYDSMEVFKKTLSSAVVEYTQADTGEVQKSDGEGSTGTDEEVPANDDLTFLATDVNTSDVSYGEDTEGNKVLRFVVSFTYAPELFSSTVETVSIRLSINGNVTDSYLGLPKSIFTERAKDIEEDR